MLYFPIKPQEKNFQFKPQIFLIHAFHLLIKECHFDQLVNIQMCAVDIDTCYVWKWGYILLLLITMTTNE